MATQDAPKPIATIPDFPRGSKIIDSKGVMTADYQLFFQQLIVALQTILTPEGILFPSETSANIALLTDIQSIANILYDSTINQFKGNILNTADLTSGTSGTQYWLPFAMITTYAGNPNTHIGGYLAELCLDTTNKVLYVCTTAGDAAGATWTAT